MLCGAWICARRKYPFRHYVALPGSGHAGVPARHRRPGPLTGGSCSFDGTSAASVVGADSWPRFSLSSASPPPATGMQRRAPWPEDRGQVLTVSRITQTVAAGGFGERLGRRCPPGGANLEARHPLRSLHAEVADSAGVRERHCLRVVRQMSESGRECGSYCGLDGRRVLSATSRRRWGWTVRAACRPSVIHLWSGWHGWPVTVTPRSG